MGKSINKHTILGNIGQDPELKPTNNGGYVLNLSIATSSSYKDKQTGDWVEKPTWHKVVFYNKVAEIVAAHTWKGAKIYVEGRSETRKWTDKDGKDNWTTETIAEDFVLIDRREQQAQAQGQQAQTPQQQYQPQQPQQPPQQYQAPSYGGNGQSAPTAQIAPPPPQMDSFDSDIPF
jgi:single-strand DNA-binding protein